MKIKLPKSFTTVTKFSKMLALMMLILFPIVGFWLGVQYQKTNETQNLNMDWNTFATGEFSFKYPRDWSEPIKTLQSTRVQYVFSPSDMTVLVGTYYDQTVQRTRTYEEEVNRIKQIAKSSKDVIVDGVQTKEYINSDERHVVLYSSKLNDIVWISMRLKKSEDQKTFDQILSTFKFTN